MQIRQSGIKDITTSVTLRLIVITILLALLPACATPLPAPTDTPLPVAQMSPISTATATATAPNATVQAPSPTLTPSPSRTVTPIPTVTDSETPTETASEPTPSLEPTPIPTSTAPPPPMTTSPSSPTSTIVASNTPAVTPPSATPAPPTPTSAPPSPTPVASSGRLFLAYYVPYDGSSWSSLQSQADKIDYLAMQWVSVDHCGSIGSRDDRTLVAFARAQGIRLLPSLLTSSGSLNHTLLTDEASTSRLIEQIVSYVVEEGYDGFDLDMEGVLPEDREALTSFVARLSAALHAQNKLLTMAVPAKTREVTTGWAGAYDYAALAPHVDFFVIMTYGYTVSASATPGSTAPYGWVDRVIAYVTSQIPPHKVLVGLAFYGYDWNITSGGRARAHLYPVSEALANWYGAPIQLDAETRSATFSYLAAPGDQPALPTPHPRPQHEIAERVKPFCSKTPPAPPPPPTATPTPLPTEPQQHVVWLENRESVAARLEIATRYGTAGVAGWRLGQEDPGVWPLLSEWRR